MAGGGRVGRILTWLLVVGWLGSRHSVARRPNNQNIEGVGAAAGRACPYRATIHDGSMSSANFGAVHAMDGARSSPEQMIGADFAARIHARQHEASGSHRGRVVLGSHLGECVMPFEANWSLKRTVARRYSPPAREARGRKRRILACVRFGWDGGRRWGCSLITL